MKQINFSDLQNYNDNNAIVCTGLLLKDDEINDVEDFFHSAGLISEDKFVLGAAHLQDNVLGNDGRSDIVIFLSEGGTIDPMVRMQMRLSGLGVMWVSDFISNYSRDYKTAC